MTYAETLLPEFDQEMANTRKVLERIPDDKLDWQAHPEVAHDRLERQPRRGHPQLARLAVLTTPSLDIAPVGGEPYESPTADQPARRSSSCSTRTSRRPARRSPRPRTRTWGSRGRCCRAASRSSPCRARP